jgi:putative transposase
MIDTCVTEIEPLIGTAPACRALGTSRASVYRRRRFPQPRECRPRQPPPRALSEPERSRVLGELNSDRFVDCSPAQVWATLLDLCRYRDYADIVSVARLKGPVCLGFEA